MPTSSNYASLQGGNAVRVTLQDGESYIDGNFRGFINKDTKSTIVVTTPLGEKDPALQQTHYLNNFSSIVRPIPATPPTPPFPIDVGDTVEVRFGVGPATQGAVVTGTIVSFSSDIAKGSPILLLVAGDPVLVQNYWSVTKL